jgi:hypothetical protein
MTPCGVGSFLDARSHRCERCTDTVRCLIRADIGSFDENQRTLAEDHQNSRFQRQLLIPE